MYLYGASGHAKVVIEILEKCGIVITGLFDDNPNIKELIGYPCTLPSLDLAKKSGIIITIGDNRTRKLIAQRFENCNFETAIDCASNISKRSIIGQGTVVMPGSTINSSCNVGIHCIINTNASVDHDCLLEDFVHIAPNVSLAGGVKIGEGSFIGIGTSIIQNVKIGKWCIIGAGSVIRKDVPDYSMVVGNPGKYVKSKL